MSNYIFDIETFAENDADVEKMVWNPVSKTYEKQYSPNPLKERIVCIVLYNTETKIYHKFINDDESMLLYEFWNTMQTDDVLYGFNSTPFDMVYINVRTFVNNIISKSIQHYDLREILFTSQRYFPGKLADFANVFGVVINTENGSKVKDMWRSKQIAKIVEHCTEDVDITITMFNRMKNCKLI